MKKSIFSFLLLLISVTTYAGDKLVIDKLLYSTSDLSGSTKPRLDANGKACALLKVSYHEKMTFEGNVVGEVIYNKGEYWVYLTEGSYMLTIKADGKDPLKLNFRDYNLKSANSKCTYLLTFHMKEYEELKEYVLISGPKLKRYNPAMFQSPFKNDAVRMATYLKEKGDGYEDSIECSIIGIKEDGKIARYAVIYGQDDEELMAAIVEVTEAPYFDVKIFEIKKK